MEQSIIIEKIKEAIGGRKVTAAVFYTFNFDAKFFENYICPLFVPDVEFGNNEIQNTILWKKYQNELPPITIFCDAHMKGQHGPSLRYSVYPVSLPLGKEKATACFHAKHSFLLCDDDSLIFLTGSNNLTWSGWSRNVECVDIQHFFKKGKKHFCPKNVITSLRILIGAYEEYWITVDMQQSEEALEKVDKFLNTREVEVLNTKKLLFLESNHQSFIDDVKLFKEKYNNNIPFQKAEVIAPYFSDSIKHYEDFEELTGCKNIHIALPMEGETQVALNEEIFDYIDNSKNYTWYSFNPKDGKEFRFCHAKMYRFWGDKKVITVIGSINFTEAAFKGMDKGGNLETAVAIVDERSEVEKNKWLTVACPNKEDLIFTESKLKEEDPEHNERYSPYDLDIEYDWSKNELIVINNNKSKQKGEVIFKSNKQGYTINNKKNIISPLIDVEIQELLETQIVTVRHEGKGYLVTYFFKSINIEQKPLPKKYNISENELFELWSQLNNIDDRKHQSRIIEKFSERLSENELDSKEVPKADGALSKVAHHVNGLLSVKQKLEAKGKKTQNPKQIEYYLWTDNIDTLLGYFKMIKTQYKKEEISLGTYWLLLNIVEHYFYSSTVFDNPKGKGKKPEVLSQELAIIDKEMNTQKVSKNKLKWLNKQLHEQAGKKKSKGNS